LAQIVVLAILAATGMPVLGRSILPDELLQQAIEELK